MKKLVSFPALILSAFLIRLLVTGASIGDSLVIIGLASLYASWSYFESKKETPVNKAILDRVVDLEEIVKSTKETVNSLKLGANLKR